MTGAGLAITLPSRGSAVTLDSLMAAERQLASAALLTDDFDRLEEWRSQARALEQYLSAKKLHGPMQGAQRRIEARIGQLLGEAEPGKRTDLEPRQRDDGVVRHNQDRHDFRLLARALSGDITLTEDEWRKSRRGLVQLIKDRIAETERMSAVDIEAAEKSGTAYNGSRINVPEDMTAEDLCRKGMERESAGETAEEIAPVIQVGLRTYRQMRDIVALADRSDLSPRDAEVVRFALDEMNTTNRIADAYERVEPIVDRVWGVRRGGPRSVIEANRIANFERAFGVVIQACSGSADIEIPYLSSARATEAISEIKEAERKLRTLRGRIEEIHQ
jgi:hypothetical protein